MARLVRRRETQAAPVAFVALSLLAGCSSLWDFDRLHPVLVTDDIHAWSGRKRRRELSRRSRSTT
jgi:hypothetical protein